MKFVSLCFTIIASTGTPDTNCEQISLDFYDADKNILIIC